MTSLKITPTQRLNVPGPSADNTGGEDTKPTAALGLDLSPAFAATQAPTSRSAQPTLNLGGLEPSVEVASVDVHARNIILGVGMRGGGVNWLTLGADVAGSAIVLGKLFQGQPILPTDQLVLNGIFEFKAGKLPGMGLFHKLLSTGGLGLEQHFNLSVTLAGGKDGQLRVKSVTLVSLPIVAEKSEFQSANTYRRWNSPPALVLKWDFPEGKPSTYTVTPYVGEGGFTLLNKSKPAPEGSSEVSIPGVRGLGYVFRTQGAVGTALSVGKGHLIGAPGAPGNLDKILHRTHDVVGLAEQLGGAYAALTGPAKTNWLGQPEKTQTEAWVRAIINPTPTGVATPPTTPMPGLMLEVGGGITSIQDGTHTLNLSLPGSSQPVLTVGMDQAKAFVDQTLRALGLAENQLDAPEPRLKRSNQFIAALESGKGLDQAFQSLPIPSEIRAEFDASLKQLRKELQAPKPDEVRLSDAYFHLAGLLQLNPRALARGIPEMNQALGQAPQGTPKPTPGPVLMPPRPLQPAGEGVARAVATQQVVATQMKTVRNALDSGTYTPQPGQAPVAWANDTRNFQQFTRWLDTQTNAWQAQQRQGLLPQLSAVALQQSIQQVRLSALHNRVMAMQPVFTEVAQALNAQPPGQPLSQALKKQLQGLKSAVGRMDAVAQRWGMDPNQLLPGRQEVLKRLDAWLTSPAENKTPKGVQPDGPGRTPAATLEIDRQMKAVAQALSNGTYSLKAGQPAQPWANGASTFSQFANWLDGQTRQWTQAKARGQLPDIPAVALTQSIHTIHTNALKNRLAAMTPVFSEVSQSLSQLLPGQDLPAPLKTQLRALRQALQQTQAVAKRWGTDLDVVWPQHRQTLRQIEAWLQPAQRPR